MIIIEPSITIEDKIDGEEILKKIEKAGRTCYKSEDKITNDSAYKFVKMILKRGHDSVLEHEKISVRIICDRGCCYDDKTKVLTDNGWKFFNELNSDDLYYSLDDGNNIVKIKANKIIKKKYKGKLHNYKSTQINLSVTPNHNMWLYDYHKRSENTRIWKFIKSEDVTNGMYKFKKSATPVKRINNSIIKIKGIIVNRGFYCKALPELEFKSKYFFEFVGWWITDGSISYPKNDYGGRLSITQIKEKGCKRIEFLLKELKLNYTKYKNDYRINCLQLRHWLTENFLRINDVKKTYYLSIPRWMFNELSAENLSRLLKGIVGGDGTKHSGSSTGVQVYTASKNFAEDLVELALCIGKRANYTLQKTRDSKLVKSSKNFYMISITNGKDHLFNLKGKKKEVDYEGYVYCVELPKYHRLYVMREGKACWCGNSHEIVRHRLGSYSQESTRYCNYNNDKFNNQLTFIKPCFFPKIPLGRITPLQITKNQSISGAERQWLMVLIWIERAYTDLLLHKCTPQEARSVLPNSLKTEIVVTYNLREWRHFLKLRTAKAAHPQMREVAYMILEQFQKLVPIIFDDINPKEVDYTKCIMCKASLEVGIALKENMSGSPDFIGSKEVCTVSPDGNAKLIDCMKCPECGWSRSKREGE